MEGFSAGLVDDEDIYRWEVVVYGPPDTVLYVGPYICCVFDSGCLEHELQPSLQISFIFGDIRACGAKLCKS